MDNVTEWIEHFGWLRVIAYGILCLIHFEKSRTTIRYQLMNCMLAITFCIAIFLSTSLIIAPSLAVYLRLVQTPIVISAAYFGLIYWRKFDSPKTRAKIKLEMKQRIYEEKIERDYYK